MFLFSNDNIFFSRNLLANRLMAEEALLGHLFVFRTWAAVVGIGVDADAATRGEDSRDLDVARVHQTDEVFHDDIHAVFMEVAVIAEGEEVELETLRLHHAHIGDIHDLDFRKVGLAGNGTQRGELGTVELYPVVVLLMAVLEGFEDFGSVVALVFCLAAQLLQAFLFSVHSVWSIEN